MSFMALNELAVTRCFIKQYVNSNLKITVWNRFSSSVCNRINRINLSHFLAHAPLSEHAPLLEYGHMEVNRNVYNIGAPACSVSPQNAFFLL